MKIAFGMIVFEGDYVLKQCLESIYDVATQILIAEGPVKYWQDRGRITSMDRTNDILDLFPDPEHKITIVHGQYSEKDDQCNAYMKHLRPDIDYLWNLDSDELYKTEDIEQLIKILERDKYTSVGVKSCSFYGGFDKYIGGFEEQTDNFLRVFRVTPGSTWLTHRPPTIKYPDSIIKSHLNSDQLYDMCGLRMYHYSYVFPRQVYNKISYYKSAVSMERCIDNYFKLVYLPWVKFPESRPLIENQFNGVHEFRPDFRPETRTKQFVDSHPDSIIKDLSILKQEFNSQLKEFV